MPEEIHTAEVKVTSTCPTCGKPYVRTEYALMVLQYPNICGLTMCDKCDEDDLIMVRLNKTY